MNCSFSPVFICSHPFTISGKMFCLYSLSSSLIFFSATWRSLIVFLMFAMILFTVWVDPGMSFISCRSPRSVSNVVWAVPPTLPSFQSSYLSCLHLSPRKYRMLHNGARILLCRHFIHSFIYSFMLFNHGTNISHGCFSVIVRAIKISIHHMIHHRYKANKNYIKLHKLSYIS